MLSHSQGAGGYLGGTGTANARIGNEKEGIKLPFAPYPRSGAASNWLGLPNDGDNINLERAGRLTFEKNAIKCVIKDRTYTKVHPIGWSVMGSPDYQGKEKLEKLVGSMCKYEKAGVDFLENNESCPNTAHGTPQSEGLEDRLKYVKEQFLDQRLTTRPRIPVVVKFSNDTLIEQVPALLDVLFKLGYDGINFGNTSINYAYHEKSIAPQERRLYNYFTSTFGGGVSGRPLKEVSLALCAAAVEYRDAGPPSHEFHVIRTGGIDSGKDLFESDQAGVSLNQWFTGYFDNLSFFSHRAYWHVYKEYREQKTFQMLNEMRTAKE